MAQCINCSNYTLRDHPGGSADERSRAAAKQMAASGLGRCTLGPSYRFPSPTHERKCPSFSQAPTTVIERRVAWLATRGQATTTTESNT